jgi:hypothetical protein
VDAVGSKSVPAASGSRKQITAHAKAKIVRSDVQLQMAEKTGGFIWHVEKWPHWLQVCVDVQGNAHEDEKPGRDQVQAWYKAHEAEVKEIVGNLLGEFGEIAILDKSMGTGPHMGGCCRLGCGGCLNGSHNKLLNKLTGDQPVDRVG